MGRTMTDGGTEQARFPWKLAGALLLLLILLALLAPTSAVGQAGGKLPFFPGEELTYRMRAGALGTIGRGTMKVTGPVEMRGSQVLLLQSEFRSRFGVVRGVDDTSSWLDPKRMASLRFHKHERTPLSRQDAAVELFPAERRWQDAEGRGGASPTDAPLDELSFIYFVRTLPLAADAVYRFDRHFATDRNPITVRVVRRETISVGAGEFAAVLVEMRVRDPERYRGEGVIRIHLTDDGCRIPLRIESTMPVLGTMVLTLESHTHPRTHGLAAVH